MISQHFRKASLLLELFAVLANCATPLNYSGTAVATRFWDCCKPSCGWDGKASVNKPVLSCTADDKPTAMTAGSGCGTGGTAFACSNQQPWAINDTFSYGYAGAFIMPDLTGGAVEGAWCCACYQLEFTSEPLRGKTMVLQANNVAYDITTTSRFSLAVPGGNSTTQDACGKQFGIDQSVFGRTGQGVSKKEDCQNLPDALKAGCQWRFDWYKDASFPSANFKRVVCPAALTDKSGCVRNDEKVLSGAVTAAASTHFTSSTAALFAAILSSVLSI